MNRAWVLPAALLIQVASTPAFAASVDLRGPGGARFGPLEVSFSDGHTATVSATSTRKVNGSTSLGHWDRGLGVWSGLGDDHRLDGRGFSETIWFDFDHAFRLTSVELSHVSPFRPETLRVLDGHGNALGDFAALSPVGSDVAIIDLFALHRTGHQRIGFSAIGSRSAFKLQGLHGVSVVPTPTAVAAGLALLIAGTMRRRSRRLVVGPDA